MAGNIKSYTNTPIEVVIRSLLGIQRVLRDRLLTSLHLPSSIEYIQPKIYHHHPGSSQIHTHIFTYSHRQIFHFDSSIIYPNFHYQCLTFLISKHLIFPAIAHKQHTFILYMLISSKQKNKNKIFTYHDYTILRFIIYQIKVEHMDIYE